MSSNIELVRASFGRSLLKGDVLGRFYELFFQCSEEITALFKDTDMDKQKEALSQGLNLAIMFADGKPFAKTVIRKIRVSHSRARMDIRPALYPLWKSNLMQAISEFDSEYSPAVEQAWDEVLQKTIDYIIEGYEG